MVSENIAKTLRGYLVESLGMIRSWMNYYFSSLGIFVFVLLVAAFQLERECGAITSGDLFHVPIVLPDGCLESAGGKKEIKLFGADVIRDFVSIMLGVAYFVFVCVLLLRIRLLVGILDQLGALFEGGEQAEEIAYDIRYFPWLASPFQKGWLGPVIFWAGLGLGVCVVGLTGAIHLLPVTGKFVFLPDTGNLVIGETLYKSIGVVNLLLFGLSVLVLFRAFSYVSAVRSAALGPAEPRVPG